MFGMSLGEIFIIAIIAILFVGPEKLPGTLVQIAKFLKGFKRSINDAKESLDKELQINELKENAINYKQQLQQSVEQMSEDAGLDKLDDIYSEFNALKSPSDPLLSDEVPEEEIKEKKKKKKKKKEKKQESEKKDA